MPAKLKQTRGPDPVIWSRSKFVLNGMRRQPHHVRGHYENVGPEGTGPPAAKLPDVGNRVHLSSVKMEKSFRSLLRSCGLNAIRVIRWRRYSSLAKQMNGAV